MSTAVSSVEGGKILRKTLRSDAQGGTRFGRAAHLRSRGHMDSLRRLLEALGCAGREARSGGRVAQNETAIMAGNNRIMIFGPKSDGTYVVEFRTAAGETLAISIPASEAAVVRYFQERMPYGLFVPFLRVHMGGIIMKTITLAVTTMLSLAAITMTAMPQSQTGNTAYEKKSYNYAEWAKGRFSEVVTVRNAGKIIYLGGVGAEDENSAQGGVIRHLGDFGAQCRYAWDKIKRLL